MWGFWFPGAWGRRGTASLVVSRPPLGGVGWGPQWLGVFWVALTAMFFSVSVLFYSCGLTAGGFRGREFG